MAPAKNRQMRKGAYFQTRGVRKRRNKLTMSSGWRSIRGIDEVRPPELGMKIEWSRT